MNTRRLPPQHVGVVGEHERSHFLCRRDCPRTSHLRQEHGMTLPDARRRPLEQCATSLAVCQHDIAIWTVNAGAKIQLALMSKVEMRQHSRVIDDAVDDRRISFPPDQSSA